MSREEVIKTLEGLICTRCLRFGTLYAMDAETQKLQKELDRLKGLKNEN